MGESSEHHQGELKWHGEARTLEEMRNLIVYFTLEELATEKAFDGDGVWSNPGSGSSGTSQTRRSLACSVPTSRYSSAS